MSDENPYEPVEQPQDITPQEPDTDDDDTALIEAAGAVRTSPYAISAFIVGLFSLYVSPQVPFAFFGAGLALRSLVVALVPIGAGVLALWLSAQGEEEIFVTDGRLGGVGFCRAGRILAMIALAIVGLGIIVSLIADTPEGLNFSI